MKLLLASVLGLAAATECTVEPEQSSLLQSNVKKDQSKDRGSHIIPIIERAASDLSLLAMDASDTQVEEVVAAFSQQLKRKVKSVSELPGSGQDALLRRASQGSQGKELSKLVTNFVKLPEATKNKVVNAVFASSDIVDAYDSLPEAEKQVLLLQLDDTLSAPGSCLDNPEQATCRKKHPKTTTEHTSEGKITKTVNGNGHEVHRIQSSRSGVETTSRDKQGHLTHSHKHQHNGYGGNSKTETRSNRGSWTHGHKHSHSYNRETGTTHTATESDTAGHGVLDWKQSHSHTHRNVEGVGTQTRTESSTASSLGTHEHKHEHYHNDQSGDFDSTTNSKSRGPQWSEMFSDDDD